ncbi:MULTISPECIES: DUF2993 domain-containing protein [Kytococcus]|uniref:LmeA family phospholipid-binding protein n=1 Tax=Kytococcus TaxID=57499 RepID=UPI0008A4D207|nr:MULTISPECIES: DUF2993 domain-containing protein [Kytococcus]OFS06946.1 hypothetical protein HMPREF3099_10680 [Kytococcus sp. HMSC28H12]
MTDPVETVGARPAAAEEKGVHEAGDRPERPGDRGARRRDRRAVAALVALLVLLLTLLVGDLALRRYVVGRIEQEVGATVHGRVRADLDGWPTAWHVARDEYPEIDGTLSGAVVEVRGRTVLVDADVRARDVRDLSGGGDAVHVEHLAGRVRTSWEDLSRVTGADLSGDEDGRLSITTDVPVMGERLPVRVTGRPVVDPATGQLGLADAQASLDEVDVPQDVVDGLLPRVATYANLPTYEGLRWTGVRATAEGVELELRGEGVDLPRHAG